MEFLFTYGILMIIAFLIGVYVTRWIFGIDKILNHLQDQTANLQVLAAVTNKLAKQQGIPEEEIKQLIDKATKGH